VTIPAPLAGLRVLVVEDEMLVSMLIEDLLADQQCEVVGPFSQVEPALKAAESERFDFALLDVNIAGTKVYPVAEAVAARQIPFLFLSGYGKDATPKDRPEWRVMSKPFKADDLVEKLIAELKRFRRQ
jgi:DNA-binding response OmpR family regulator